MLCHKGSSSDEPWSRTVVMHRITRKKHHHTLLRVQIHPHHVSARLATHPLQIFHDLNLNICCWAQLKPSLTHPIWPLSTRGCAQKKLFFGAVCRFARTASRTARIAGRGGQTLAATVMARPLPNICACSLLGSRFPRYGEGCPAVIASIGSV